MKAAIFGGSFDPVHLGHLFLADEARHYFSLDKVIFVPAFVSPFKNACGANAEFRLKMLEAATADNDFFCVDDFDLQKGGKSFSIDTVRHFAQKFDEKPAFVLGDDLLEKFFLWKNCDEIAQTVDLLVGRRERTFDLNKNFFESGEKKFPCRFFPNAFFPMSSREIRSRIASGESWRYFVTEKVAKIISENSLYSKCL